MPDANPNQTADQPDCLTMDDAIAAVRKCLRSIIGGNADKIKMGTSIGDVLPDSGDLVALRSLLACLKDSTKFDLDADDFAGGTFQDIADKLACAGEDA